MAHDSERWSPSDELLDQFLAERTAPDERAAIEAWLVRTPAAQRTVQALRQLRFGMPVSDAERMSLWRRIERRCREGEALQGIGGWNREGTVRQGNSKERTLRRRVLKGQTLRRNWYVLAGLMLGIVALIIRWPVSRSLFVPHWPVSVATYVTEDGQRATITLNDGSTVALGVASRLEVPMDYAEGNRTVRLKGEALFTVPHHDRTPFTVMTNTTTTRVLGTSFLVRHYTTDSVTLVAVQNGRVIVESKTVRPLVVTAAQQVAVSRNGNVQVGQADLAQFTFAAGVLTLHDLALRDAIVELDRWYGADIRVGDEILATRRITIECTAGSLADLTNVLQLAFNLRVVRHGRVLTLFPR